MKAENYFKNELDISFAKAIEKGDDVRMEELIKQGANVNAIGQEEMRPLFWAIMKQSVPGFSFLLKQGANPNIEIKNTTARNRTLPLIELAAIAEDSAYLALLLRHGADPNNKPEGTEETVIYEAIINNRIDNVRLLVEAGADINHQNFSKETPMMTAAAIKNFDMVYLFLEKGSNPTIKDRWGNDLAWMIKEFADRGIKRNSEQHGWYLKVVEEMKRRSLL